MSHSSSARALPFDLAAQADYLATNMSNGEYYDYDFNCVCLAQGNGE